MKKNFGWNELLDFLSRDFSEYAWSLRALDRRQEFFTGITREENWKGPENSLVCRYRCTRWKRLINLRGRKAKGNFTSRGPNWVHALDSHDKIINGLSKQHYPYRRLRMHWHLQPKNGKQEWWLYRTPFSDNIMGTWIQWRQSCMGHQLPIKYVYFLCDAVFLSLQSIWRLQTCPTLCLGN